MQSTSAPFPAPPRSLAAVALGIFLLLGIIYPILGPALPRLSAQFGLQATGASLLLSANSAGAFLGVVLAGLLPERLMAERRAALALMLTALGSLGLAFAPDFPLALLASGLLGLGFGMLDLTINVWLSVRYGERSAAMLNLLSAGFGVGAVLAPLAVGRAGGNVQLPLLGCAVFAGLLLWPLLKLPRSPAPTTHLETTGSTPTPLRKSARPVQLLLGVFILLFMVYVAVEGGVGAWEVTALQDSLGLSTAAASQISSLYWVFFTAGRMITAPLTLRFAPPQLVTGALALAVISLACAAIPAAAPAAYSLTGLFLAPVFATSLVWLSRELPGKSAPTLVFAGGFLGPVLFSPVIGSLRDTFGPAATPLALTGIAALDLLLVVWLVNLLRRRPRLAV
ncbi:MFS transporter [Deinococcus rubellus]|uniref:MFS transporter n=1 Tax=Deinococcus rubellus TaxID=1889240 RepID=A0ABY5YF35_9DEIO|nr:MFS transporter [Deinococcus rubellus]UWX63695.1 MFS transporter [Deinococcus rubellus]